jgi:hypothetical protein
MSQSKSGSTKSDSPASVGFAPLTALMPLQLAYMQAMTKATQAFMDGMVTINREMLAFADERARAMREDVSKPAGGEPMAVWNRHLDRTTSATQAYMQEASRLLELGMRVSQDSWAPLQEQLSNTLGNGQAKAEPPKAE